MKFSRGKMAVLTFIVAMSMLIPVVAALNPSSPTSRRNDQQGITSKPEGVSDPGLGTGILHVYVDSERTTEAPTNPAGNYMVLYGATYHFRITGITEYPEGESINVWAHFVKNILINSFTIEADGTIEFDWTIPTDLPPNTPIKYKYGTNPSWYLAKKATEGAGITFAIPEVTLGPLGATLILFSGLGITTLIRGKRTHKPS